MFFFVKYINNILLLLSYIGQWFSWIFKNWIVRFLGEEKIELSEQNLDHSLVKWFQWNHFTKVFYPYAYCTQNIIFNNYWKKN